MSLYQRFRAFLDSKISRVAGMSAEALKLAQKPQEPSFTLHGDDPLASALVRAWCERAERSGVNRQKILGALAIAGRMDEMDPDVSFTLRGQDALATGIVQMWIQRAKGRHGIVDPVLIDEAQTKADAMAVYSPKKIPD